MLADRQAERCGPGLEQALALLGIGARGHGRGDGRGRGGREVRDRRRRCAEIAGPELAQDAVEALDVRPEVVVAAGPGVAAPRVQPLHLEARETAAAAGHQGEPSLADGTERTLDADLTDRRPHAV